MNNLDLGYGPASLPESVDMRMQDDFVEQTYNHIFCSMCREIDKDTGYIECRPMIPRWRRQLQRRKGGKDLYGDRVSGEITHSEDDYGRNWVACRRDK